MECGAVTATTVELDLETTPVHQGVRTFEQALIEEARQRQRRRHRWLVVSLVIAVVAGSTFYAALRRQVNQPPINRSVFGARAAVIAGECKIGNFSISGVGNQGAAGSAMTLVYLVNHGPSCALSPIAVRAYNTSTHSYVGPVSRIMKPEVTKFAGQLTYPYAAPKLLGRLGRGKTADLLFAYGEPGISPASMCRPAPANEVGFWVANIRRSVQFVRIPFGSGKPPTSFTSCTKQDSFGVWWPSTGPFAH
jgi:hypothetical protein